MKKVLSLFAVILMTSVTFMACEPEKVADAGDENVFENVSATGDEGDDQDIDDDNL